MSDDDIRLDWSAAEVHDGELTVPLTGERSKQFSSAFEHAEKLIGAGHADWGEVRLKKNAVRVGAVRSGSEDKLRFHLEGLVQQAIATVTADSGDEGGEPEGPDGEMTARFRAFAEDSPPPPG